MHVPAKARAEAYPAGPGGTTGPRSYQTTCIPDGCTATSTRRLTTRRRSGICRSSTGNHGSADGSPRCPPRITTAARSGCRGSAGRSHRRLNDWRPSRSGTSQTARAAVVWRAFAEVSGDDANQPEHRREASPAPAAATTDGGSLRGGIGRRRRVTWDRAWLIRAPWPPPLLRRRRTFSAAVVAAGWQHQGAMKWQSKALAPTAFQRGRRGKARSELRVALAVLDRAIWSGEWRRSLIVDGESCAGRRRTTSDASSRSGVAAYAEV